MNVIYALFEQYPDAREGGNALLEQGYDEDEMNAPPAQRRSYGATTANTSIITRINRYA